MVTFRKFEVAKKSFSSFTPDIHERSSEAAAKILGFQAKSKNVVQDCDYFKGEKKIPLPENRKRFFLSHEQ